MSNIKFRKSGKVLLKCLSFLVFYIIVIAPGLSILYLSLKLTDSIPIHFLGFFGGIFTVVVLNQIFKPAELLR